MKNLILIKFKILSIINFFISFDLAVLFTVSLGGFTLNELIVKYIYADFDFLPFLFIAITLNTIAGAIAAFKKNIFSISKLIIDPSVNAFLYAIILISIHLLTHFEISGKRFEYLDWLPMAIYAALITKEVISTAENIEKFKPGFVPGWYLSKLAKFKESGKLTDLANEQV